MSSNRKGLIWSIDHPKLTYTSWLVATMHVHDDRAYGHFEKARSLMSNVSLFLAETDIDQLLSGQLKMPANHSEYFGLKETLGQKKYEKARRVLLKAFDVDIAIMNDQRPMIVMNQMSLLTLNMDRPLPLDAALWQSAKAMDLQVQGLESFEEQTNLLFQLSIDMQVKMFNQMCRNVSKFRNRTLRLMDLFMDQDLHGIYRMTIKDLGGMRDQLVYNRNTTMAHRLANLMQEGPLMAAIGGGHFSGYKGLIKLLNSSGYKLTPYHL